MHEFNIILTVLGGMILLLGLISRPLGAGPLPPTVLGLALGVAVGPAGLGLIDLEALGEPSRILEGAARLVLAIGLMGVALRVPREYPRRNWRALAGLVGVGMPLMWAASTLLVWLILGEPFWLAALIGAIVTPTDPIAATPIVTGDVAEQNVPERLRNAISSESGLNDGLGYLFVFLPLLVLTRPEGEAVGRWLSHVLLWDVVAATVIGLALGWVCGTLLRWAERGRTVEQNWRLVYTVCVALLAAGGGRLLGGDEVLVIFAAGAAFAQVVGSDDRDVEERGQEAVNRFFSFPVFTLIGIAIPWDGWRELGWRGVALAAAVLLLRRPPMMLVLGRFLPVVRGVREALFVGWFGPIAVSALYYAALAEHRTGRGVVFDATMLVIVASTVVHGVTGAPLTKLLGRSGGRRKVEAEADAKAATA